MAKTLWLLIGGILISSCGTAKKDESSLPPIADPNAGPAISQRAEKQPADPAEIKKLLDLEEYPGSEQLENNRLLDPALPPDEARFELVRRSKDAPDKVVAFFEEKLGEKAIGSAGHKEVFGRTQRGNSIKVHVDGEGDGSKYTLIVIAYKK